MTALTRVLVSPFGDEPEVLGARHALGDLPELLRRRLRFIVLVAGVTYTGFSTIGIIAYWSRFVAEPWKFISRPPYFVVYYVLAGILFSVAEVLSRRRLSYRVLRLIEGVTVVGSSVLFAVLSAAMLSQWPAALLSRWWLINAFGFAVPGSLFVITYGVFIPNSRRRATLVICLLALLATLPDALAFVRQGALIPGAAGYLLLKSLIVWTFSVCAIYGAHRIEALTQAAHSVRTVGPYRLKKQIGEGGMGEVYLAEHELLRRPCAVKIIRAENGADEGALARFEREVQTTATLTHPNTVQIYDYGRATDGTFFYAMEYLPGTSLEQLVAREGALPPARACRFLIQLCGALREAHDLGLIHRDIKPSNVIICDRGGIPDVVKLLDFGLVTTTAVPLDTGRLTHDGMLVGTPEFMSPEQCSGEEQLTPASDIYSLGALGYFMLAATSPFAGRMPMRMLAAHLYETPPPLAPRGSGVPHEVEAVIMRCLAKAATDRYTDMASVAIALQRALV